FGGQLTARKHARVLLEGCQRLARAIRERGPRLFEQRRFASQRILGDGRGSRGGGAFGKFGFAAHGGARARRARANGGGGRGRARRRGRAGRGGGGAPAVLGGWGPVGGGGAVAATVVSTSWLDVARCARSARAPTAPVTQTTAANAIPLADSHALVASGKATS